jgi:hypothetical protein
VPRSRPPSIHHGQAYSNHRHHGCERDQADNKISEHLGLRPRETFSLIAEFTTSGSAVEFPVDRDAVTVHPPVPSFGLSAQPLQIGDSPTTQALPREDADFDLRLIEPAAVSGRVMDGEAIPDFCSHFRAEDGGQRFPAMDVEVVHYQVDGLRFRVCHRQRDGNLSELDPAWRR